MPVPISQSPSRVRARRRVAAGPAEALGAEAQALLEPVARPRVAARVERRCGCGGAARPGRCRARSASSSMAHLEHDDAERLAGAAREGRRHRVAADQAVDARGSCSHRVELRGDAGRGLGPVVERRGERELLVVDRRQAPVARRAERDPLLLLLAVAVGGEHLRPREHEPHRPADLLARPSRPASRAATPSPSSRTSRRRTARARGRATSGSPSRCGDGQLGGADAHRRLVDREPVAVPHRRASRAPPSGCGGWRPCGTATSIRTSAARERRRRRRRARCGRASARRTAARPRTASSRPSSMVVIDGAAS